MLKKFNLPMLNKPGLQRHLYKVPLFLTILILASMWAVPFVVPNDASAAQITSRSLSLSSGQPGGAGALTYTYTFTQPTVGSIQSIKFVACDTATTTYGFASVSTTTGCVAPTGPMTMNAGSQVGTLNGNWQSTTAFTIQSSTLGNCTPAANVLCIKRTSATSETATNKFIAWNGQTNPSTANSTFYVGMYIYSDNAFATPTDSGTVAAAVSQSLTVTAAVAEILVFCVGSTSVDDATTAVGNATSCTGVTVDLGTLDPTSINFSKTNGNNLNGVAILRTNAINGSSVSYDAILDGTGTTHTGALRIVGANCTTVPGSCITSKGTTQGVFAAGTQDFGMTIAGTNCGTETAGSYYSCSYSGATEHLVPQSPYVGRTGDYCTTTCNTDNGFAWQETGASSTLATASASNVVADEALILKFAATPSITNTFGPYQVKVDYTAVPTF